MPETLEETVTRLVSPLVRAQGLGLWGVEVLPGGRTKVRVFVDVPRPAQPAGAAGAEAPAEEAAKAAFAEPGSASIDQCEEISRQLGIAMDVEDCVPEAWVLEVSSPGLDRRFFSLDQMAPYVGDLVEARLASPVTPEGEGGAAPRLRWRGRLTGVDADGFTLEPCAVSADGEVRPEGGAPVHLPWAEVRRASRIPVFQKPAKPGKGPGKAPGKGRARHPSQAGRARAAAGGRHES
ncbi:MAG: ribosome maturation factor RimP [Desulfovibrio sp.]|uniref:ribosome maturation factor RimP n=1 Tax=Desulfovibrio sp. TaxID=885 RepID=UPI001A64917B|nr:ribosome maturation factor RimP [Desulfovibrio sp.]MBD5418297.1 ribosome maturation factor RimP [Desulfovibrio sp.]